MSANDVKCPYCGADNEICHDDGYGYDECELHRQECDDCGKTYVYETSVFVYHKAFAAPCIDGDAEHDWKETLTFPRFLRKLRCSVCGEYKEIEGIEEERKAYLAELRKR